MCFPYKKVRCFKRHAVSQGSVLDPILFIIFIHDLPKCVNCLVCLFADDHKIYCKVHTINSDKPEDIDEHEIL